MQLWQGPDSTSNHAPRKRATHNGSFLCHAGAVFADQLARRADVVGDDVVEVLALQLGQREEAAGLIDPNPLVGLLASEHSGEMAVCRSQNVGQHIRIDPALLQRSGGEILIWLQFIVTQGQALGRVERNNAPQDTRNVRVVVEEQFPLQHRLTG
jgi:hypothetical protein